MIQPDAPIVPTRQEIHLLLYNDHYMLLEEDPLGRAKQLLRKVEAGGLSGTDRVVAARAIVQAQSSKDPMAQALKTTKKKKRAKKQHNMQAVSDVQYAEKLMLKLAKDLEARGVKLKTAPTAGDKSAPPKPTASAVAPPPPPSHVPPLPQKEAPNADVQGQKCFICEEVSKRKRGGAQESATLKCGLCKQYLHVSCAMNAPSTQVLMGLHDYRCHICRVNGMH